MKNYNVIGIMSGTSLDGIDIALCSFHLLKNKWEYKIVKAETYQYTNIWKKRLTELPKSNALKFVETNIEYGKLLGETINKFLNTYNLKADFISSHGHTIFHQPDKHITSQIGDGATIAAITGIDVICNFRTMDVALSGQGAPLVPIGDELLFSDYDICINLGGFSNISFKKNNIRIAFDICPCNIILNYLSNKLNKPFDDKGKIACSGKCNTKLLNQLNNIDYYKKSYPKSLSREWLENNFIPLIDDYNIDICDKLNTVTEHIATQISKYTNIKDNLKILITGGGAKNDYLIKKLKAKTKNTIIIPDNIVIDYKESLIFAFLGVLRKEEQINCLKSVTGAIKDNTGGCIYKA
ncbi:MAG: anhydro-N-acetylmuramic acid kinase [Bacteroidales bacterium]|nr:anhydro-N-acetylmuramic acid kinase [Bacteroidales bacterium]